MFSFAVRMTSVPRGRFLLRHLLVACGDLPIRGAPPLPWVALLTSSHRQLGTHIDAAGNVPVMVDVGAKVATQREATAVATLQFPPAVAAVIRRAAASPQPSARGGRRAGRAGCSLPPLRDRLTDVPPSDAVALSALRSVARERSAGERWRPFSFASSKKGLVAATAVVAAVMAAKSCSSLIPLCHPLPLTKCHAHVFGLSPQMRRAAVVVSVATHHRTGVEMEALVSAAVGALTVYDMLKGIDGAQPGMKVDGVRLVAKSGGKRDISRRQRNRSQTAFR